MLNFLDELKEGYAKADKALGGFLPGGGTGNPLSNTVREGALKARDAALDAADRPFHQDLFIKAHTGGQSGDGVLRELPENVLESIKGAATEQENFMKSTYEDLEGNLAAAKKMLEDPNSTFVDKNAASGYINKIYPMLKEQGLDARVKRSKSGSLSLYSHGTEAHLGLGTIGLYYDKNGNVLIKDKWKVDRKAGKIKNGSYADLVEGGRLPTEIHDLARKLGAYKDIPIEVRLSKEEWEKISNKSFQDIIKKDKKKYDDKQAFKKRLEAMEKRLGLSEDED